MLRCERRSTHAVREPRGVRRFVEGVHILCLVGCTDETTNLARQIEHLLKRVGEGLVEQFNGQRRGPSPRRLDRLCVIVDNGTRRYHRCTRRTAAQQDNHDE